MRTIQYGRDLETGLIWSRVGSEVAMPILDYGVIRPEIDFETGYFLIRTRTSVLRHTAIQWTRKVSKRIKNVHREFWGFKLLK